MRACRPLNGPHIAGFSFSLRGDVRGCVKIKVNERLGYVASLSGHNYCVFDHIDKERRKRREGRKIEERSFIEVLHMFKN